MIELQSLADLLDQLDLALDQLFLDDRNHDRFALILVDNAAELALRARIKSISDTEPSRNSLISVEDYQKRLRRALGREFDEKVKFGVSVGWLSQEQGDAIIRLHGFRNTSYHQGLRHEGILHSVAVSYLRLVCELLIKNEVGSYASCGSDAISYRAMKYLGRPACVHTLTNLTNAFQKVLDVSLTFGDSIIDDLASDLDSVIEAANASISFISGSSDAPGRRDWAVIFTQAFVFAQDDNANEKAQAMGFDPLKNKQLLDWLIDDYRNWPFLRDPVPNWRNRLKSLRSEKSANKAIKKYCDFMSQTYDIRQALEDVESQVDGYIDLQAEILRGK